MYQSCAAKRGGIGRINHIECCVRAETEYGSARMVQREGEVRKTGYGRDRPAAVCKREGKKGRESFGFEAGDGVGRGGVTVVVVRLLPIDRRLGVYGSRALANYRSTPEW